MMEALNDAETSVQEALVSSLHSIGMNHADLVLKEAHTYLIKHNKASFTDQF